MRKIIYSICLITCFVIFPNVTKANVQVSAENAILMDQSTGRVLFEKEANTPTLIASITKIMTAIIAIESGKLEEKVKISDKATITEGSSIYLKQDDVITLEELVYGLMLRSGNDAAVAISEHVGGSEEGFTYLMNEKAKWIGMNNSHFDNPHGLDSENHYSSAYDMAILTKYAMENPVFREISSTSSYSAKSRDYPWINKNKLLTHLYKYSNGGKTGYTRAAGRTLVSTAEKNGQTLIAVTLNASNDWQDHIQLFEWGFKEFPLYKLQEPITFTLPSPSNHSEVIEASIKEEIYYPLAEEELNQIHQKNYVVEEPLSFQQIGKRAFYLNGKLIIDTAIYQTSSTEDNSQGFWENFWQQVHRFLGDTSD
ncbi:D-alanyl-D-alanine carboxypeptidase family protein [Gracilibacillus kekensis]|uniref:D-alanyl-D-alanine carboxypeptidase n=1 Tax=Gracilibacillus kekensis TaxID=1027249 RepID=A0A1M7PSH6_9BACI|nr:D-alanyl-D-alanine carboxypeptidase family protein [Gracilibacillus kekensis]SHN20229.1 D-alanyl-D-alanine carboxypeptidase [Gracilibacillus kekensis]